MAAEQRRGRKRDPPAPAGFGEGPLDSEARERPPLAERTRQRLAAVQFSAADKSLNRLAAPGRVGPNRRDERWMRDAEPALAVERPQKAGIRRKRFAKRAERRIVLLPGGFGLGTFAIPSRGSLAIRHAQSRRRRQEPARASWRGDADETQIDAGRAPLVDRKAHLLKTRLANGKRRSQMAQASSRRAFAPRQPGLERLAVPGVEQSQHGRARAHDEARRKQDRQPRIVGEPLSWRVMGVEGRGRLFARQARDFGGGRWRRVGQSRRS